MDSFHQKRTLGSSCVFFALVLSLWQISLGLSLANSEFGEIFHTPPNDKFLKKVYQTKDGLPQNSINSIIQTRDGYLWFATFGGLVRYDGLNFTSFVTNDTPNLISIRITALYEDKDGVLWIGSEEGHLMKYQNGEFSVVFHNKDRISPIAGMLLDKENNLWLIGGGVKIYNLETKKVFFYETNSLLDSQNYFNSPEVLKNKDDFAILFEIKESPDGGIWIASDGGLIEYKNGKFTNHFKFKGLPTLSIRSFHFDSQGKLWVINSNDYGTLENGVFTSLLRFSDLPLNKRLNPSPLLIDRENNVFFTHQEKLFKISGQNWESFDISDVIKTTAKGLVYDSEGGLWIGTNTELVQLRKRIIKIYNLPFRDLAWSANTAIIETPDKMIWSGTSNSLLRYKNGEFEKFPLTPDSGLKPQSYVTSMAVDKNETLWIGTLNGITTYKNGRFSKFYYPEENKDIGSLFFDQDGGLWIGNRFYGLLKYKNGVFTKYTKEQGLVGNLVTYITQTRDGTMWIGTKDGLSRLENGTFTNFTTANGLTNNYVREIYEDQDGTIWIGTYGGGLLRYRNNEFVPITSNNGLPEDIASRILVDEWDIFWILGNKGIYSISRQILNDYADGKIKKVIATVYDTEDGMETAEGNGGVQYAGWRAGDGRLWFSMIQGGVIIEPPKHRSPPPPIYIKEVLINDKAIDILNPPPLLPGQGMQITYTAVNFTKPKQVQFRYQLEGYDPDWKDAKDNRIAKYTSLPPGNYTFKVMAVTSDGIWSQQTATFSFKVSSPFWKTIWFNLLVMLFILLLVVVFYQIRLRRLEDKRQKKESFSRQLIYAYESERQRIASELHDGLGQNLLIIKNWAVICLDKTPPNSNLKQEITDIFGCATNALQEMRNITRNLRPQSLQVEGLTKTLEKMSKQIETTFKIKFENEIENIDRLFSEEEELSIYRIVQESLNNLVKHSGATQAQIIIKRFNAQAGEKVKISIIDNGRGFNLDLSDKSSFGLNNMAQRAELMGGKLKIDSAPGSGTKVSVSLKVKPKIENKNSIFKVAQQN